MSYTQFNILFGLGVVLVTLPMRLTKQEWVLALRTCLIITLISYPWDFFAIQLRAWSHPDPGLRLFSVPLNDLAFIFLCTAVSSAIFIRLQKRPIRHPN